MSYAAEAQTAESIERTTLLVNSLTSLVHGATAECGWWDKSEEQKAADRVLNSEDFAYLSEDAQTALLAFSNQGRNVGELLCLIHSEISEGMEGARKNLKDDHLTDMDMLTVELGDAVIRILDMAGGLGLNIGSAIARKLAYNMNRADHKPENRNKEGGKSF